MTLVIEMSDGKGGWHEVIRVGPGSPPGTLSHRAPDGRQLFRFIAEPDSAIIQRSKGGTDISFGLVRMTNTVGFEEVARLTPEDPIEEFWIQSDRLTEPVLVRARHEA